MTHPLVQALQGEIAELYGCCNEDTAEAILLALLRHPAMREPSEAVVDAAFNAQPIPSMRAPKGWMATAWRAGCDALAREIEESGR